MSAEAAFRLGRMVFAPGVRRLHVFSFLIVALFSTCMMAGINFLQPLLLTEYLRIPAGEQGSIAGNLVFWNEVVMLALIGVFGALSDKIGRALIYAAGFAVMAVAYWFFPRVHDVDGLLGVRLGFALGAAAVNAMLGTVMADYPSDHSRGKFTGLIGVMTGVGIMLIVFIFSKIPRWLENAGFDAAAAGRGAFAVIAAVCLCLAVLAALGLKRRGIMPLARQSLGDLMRQGIVAAKQPSIRLAYCASFVSRGDLAIVGTFLSLWIVNHSVAQGMSTPEALKRAGMIFGISQGAALLWAPVIGVICDRFNRLLAMSLALFLAALGYLGMGFIKDPVGLPMILASIVLGIGEISAVIAAQALIGREAPAATRGSVVGAFGIFGALGILLATKAGGLLFDQISPAAPFVAIGSVNALVLLVALFTWHQSRAAVPARSLATGQPLAPVS